MGVTKENYNDYHAFIGGVMRTRKFDLSKYHSIDDALTAFDDLVEDRLDWVIEDKDKIRALSDIRLFAINLHNLFIGIDSYTSQGKTDL